jgi:transcriptional regulator with XRE-family HTH domain
MSDSDWKAKRGPYWIARLAANVRAAREAAGLSQAELAVRSGMVSPVISRLESGKHFPTLASFLRIAEALGVEPAQLLEPRKKT